MNFRRISVLTGFFVILSICSYSAPEVTMTADVIPPNNLGSISPTGTGIQDDPYTYTFTTTNGLYMDIYKIYGNGVQNKHTKLILSGGDITSATIGGLYVCTNLNFSSANASQYASSISIQNARDIRIGKIWTYQATLNGADSGHNGGHVWIGTNTVDGRVGKVEVTEIRTYAGNAYTGASCGNVSINSTNDVEIWDGNNANDVLTYHPVATADGGSAGYIAIRHDGALLVRYMFTSNANLNAQAGYIYLNGDILNDGASGSLQSYELNTTARSTSFRGGHVTITGYTNITVTKGIFTYNWRIYEYTSSGGNVSITGTANIVLGDIWTYTEGAYGSGKQGGDISIVTTGGSVSVSNINTTARVQDYTHSRAGNVFIQAQADITIRGTEIDLRHKGTTDIGYWGYMNLTNTNSNAIIQLSSLNATNLRYTVFHPGSGKSYITSLTNFATNYTSGSGTVVDPYVTTQNRLRTPAGKKIYYEPSRSENAYLGEYTYKVADQNGNAGQGGILTPRRPAGTVIFFR